MKQRHIRGAHLKTGRRGPLRPAASSCCGLYSCCCSVKSRRSSSPQPSFSHISNNVAFKTFSAAQTKLRRYLSQRCVHGTVTLVLRLGPEEEQSSTQRRYSAGGKTRSLRSSPSRLAFMSSSSLFPPFAIPYSSLWG